VLYIPELYKNFFSVTKATKMETTIEFSDKGALLKDNKKNVIGTAKRINGLYILTCFQSVQANSD
jgi:hypothetical protein